MGESGFSAGAATYISMAIDRNNIPFVAYADGANSGKATVMKFSGTNWITVGSPGFSAGNALFTSIVLDSSNMPYVAYEDVVYNYKATIMKFNGIN